MRIRISLIATIVFLLLIPMTAHAATEADSGWGWLETVGRWINLLVLFGLIAYFTREPLKRFFSERRESIQVEIEEAKQAQAKAEEELAAMKKTVADLDQELIVLRKEAEQEAELERRRILDQAEEEAAKIIASAERQIGGLTRAARQELRAFAAELSVELARDKIKKELDDKTRDQIIDRFFVSLGSGETSK